jgi:phage shock protein A
MGGKNERNSLGELRRQVATIRRQIVQLSDEIDHLRAGRLVAAEIVASARAIAAYKRRNAGAESRINPSVEHRPPVDSPPGARVTGNPPQAIATPHRPL